MPGQLGTRASQPHLSSPKESQPLARVTVTSRLPIVSTTKTLPDQLIPIVFAKAPESKLQACQHARHWVPVYLNNFTAQGLALKPELQH